METLPVAQEVTETTKAAKKAAQKAEKAEKKATKKIEKAEKKATKKIEKGSGLAASAGGVQTMGGGLRLNAAVVGIVVCKDTEWDKQAMCLLVWVDQRVLS